MTTQLPPPPSPSKPSQTQLQSLHKIYSEHISPTTNLISPESLQKLSLASNIPYARDVLNVCDYDYNNDLSFDGFVRVLKCVGVKSKIGVGVVFERVVAVGAAVDGEKKTSVRKKSIIQLTPKRTLPVPDAEELNSTLQNVFLTYSLQSQSQTHTLSNTNYLKLLKDTNLVTKKSVNLTTVSADLIFTKCKNRNKEKGKNIEFDDFRNVVVPLLSHALGILEASLLLKIHNAFKANNYQAKSTGTVAQYNKLFDDKKLYTGTSAKGGPINNDFVSTLEGLSDRDAGCDIRGVVNDRLSQKSHMLNSPPPPPRSPAMNSPAPTPSSYHSLNRDSPSSTTQSMSSPRKSPNSSQNPSSSSPSKSPNTSTASTTNNTVYDRLHSPASYTGVYLRRHNGNTNGQGGGINGVDGVWGRDKGRVGNTNSGLDKRVIEISDILRR